jgi:hypothetical protein
MDKFQLAQQLLKQAGVSIDDNIVNDFRGVVQFESGGRHYDARGNVLKSPYNPNVGQYALGISQILPTTAASVNRKYGMRLDPGKEIDNLALGLAYFAQLDRPQVGNDSIARRLNYVAGENSQALNNYLKTGQIPQGKLYSGETRGNATFADYVRGTGDSAPVGGDTTQIPPQMNWTIENATPSQIQITPGRPAAPAPREPVRPPNVIKTRSLRGENEELLMARPFEAPSTQPTPPRDMGAPPSIKYTPSQVTFKLGQAGVGVSTPQTAPKDGVTTGPVAPTPKGGTVTPKGGVAPQPQTGTVPTKEGVVPQDGTTTKPQGGVAPQPNGGVSPQPKGGAVAPGGQPQSEVPSNEQQVPAPVTPGAPPETSTETGTDTTQKAEPPKPYVPPPVFGSKRVKDAKGNTYELDRDQKNLNGASARWVVIDGPDAPTVTAEASDTPGGGMKRFVQVQGGLIPESTWTEIKTGKDNYQKSRDAKLTNLWEFTINPNGKQLTASHLLQLAQGNTYLEKTVRDLILQQGGRNGAQWLAAAENDLKNNRVNAKVDSIKKPADSSPLDMGSLSLVNGQWTAGGKNPGFDISPDLILALELNRQGFAGSFLGVLNGLKKSGKLQTDENGAYVFDRTGVANALDEIASYRPKDWRTKVFSVIAAGKEFDGEKTTQKGEPQFTGMGPVDTGGRPLSPEMQQALTEAGVSYDEIKDDPLYKDITKYGDYKARNVREEVQRQKLALNKKAEEAANAWRNAFTQAKTEAQNRPNPTMEGSYVGNKFVPDSLQGEFAGISHEDIARLPDDTREEIFKVYGGMAVGVVSEKDGQQIIADLLTAGHEEYRRAVEERFGGYLSPKLGLQTLDGKQIIQPDAYPFLLMDKQVQKQILESRPTLSMNEMDVYREAGRESGLTTSTLVRLGGSFATSVKGLLQNVGIPKSELPFLTSLSERSAAYTRGVDEIADESQGIAYAARKAKNLGTDFAGMIARIIVLKKVGFGEPMAMAIDMSSTTVNCLVMVAKLQHGLLTN